MDVDGQIPPPDGDDEKVAPAGNNAYFDEKGQEAVEDALEFEPMSNGNAVGDTYHPINPGDTAALAQLASQMSRRKSYQSRRSSSALDVADVERKGTLEGLELDDPMLDPERSTFDLYKWIRMTLSLLDEEGIKTKRAGVVFKDVNVSGSGSAVNVQSTVGSILTSPLRITQWFSFGQNPAKHILRDFDGLLKGGELLIVLGRPGSGCSTLLKTLTWETHGLRLDDNSRVHYNGIPRARMMKEFKGEVIYNQEVDKHFPHLTVGETLEHAAALRTPRHRALNVSRQQFVEHITKVVMAVYGLSHTYNTKVGNDFVRGVSGGERKRVSLAEMVLAGSPLSAWDNSTRGLDSATALAFTRSLQQTANLVRSAHTVAIYQASQAIYDLFDKAVVLYDGREVFFGPTQHAKPYFEAMGWHCPQRQTTGDFLTSVTNPVERQAKPGFEEKVPRTPDEFEAYWRRSTEFAALQKDIQAYEEQFPLGSTAELEDLRSAKRDQQARHARLKSPNVVSISMQIPLNTRRAYRRVWNDKPSTLTPIIGNVVMAVIVGSVFFGTPNATAGFTSKGAVLFFAILLNALAAIAEINNLYSQRPIVEKHKSYAFYHPATEAIAGIVFDIPLKFLQAVAFNVVLYFMAGLRREPSQFFIFFLVNFTSTFTMTAVFRTVASLTKTISQAMAFSGVLVLAIVVYTGFVVPVKYMHPWFSWICFINPVFYAFEILMANEFHGREFTCSAFVPAYPLVQGDSFICSSKGAVAGRMTVNGETFVKIAYGYYYTHVWRNFGILLAFLVGFMIMYFVATELNSSTTSTAEVLVFRPGHIPRELYTETANGASEKVTAAEGREGDAADVIPPQTDVFTWRDVVYDIEIKGQPRRLLDHVSGWVKPGTLTALMGTSGAGKTTLA